MSRKYWRGRPLDLGGEDAEPFDALGPDLRDADLLEGREADGLRDRLPGNSLLQRYGIPALALLAILSLLIPMLAVLVR